MYPLQLTTNNLVEQNLHNELKFLMNYSTVTALSSIILRDDTRSLQYQVSNGVLGMDAVL